MTLTEWVACVAVCFVAFLFGAYCGGLWAKMALREKRDEIAALMKERNDFRRRVREFLEMLKP